MKENRYPTLPEWVWWNDGECVVRVLSAGHFPTTIMARLPNDTECEIEIAELELQQR